MSGAADNARPSYDKVIADIANYVHDYEVTSPVAWKTARLCLLDSLGCAFGALKYPQAQQLVKPIVSGMTVPNGVRVPGTDHVHEPLRGAYSIGTLVRFLDFNDTGLMKEWFHPSDALGAILSIADWQTRLAKSTGGKEGHVFKIKDILECMIKAHEIQGCIALENSFNRVGIDHVILVKVASTAVISKMLGLSREQTMAAISHAFVDGQAMRTYRHAPNTMSRKSWAAGDACMRAVHLALLVKGGEGGMPSVLTAKTWGFYDVLFKGQPFKFQRDYGSYIMENVLFKISFPAEFHAQTAVEAAVTVHKKLQKLGKTTDDIKHIRIRTQEAAIRIIDKKGPLYNYADRDHCIQYMVAVPLIKGSLVADDYHDKVASDPRIDELRSKMECVEDARFSTEYHAPDKRSIGNALQVTLKDGTVLDEVEVEYPIGHRRRREEGIPLLLQKFDRHLRELLPDAEVSAIQKASEDNMEGMDVDSYVDLYTK